MNHQLSPLTATEPYKTFLALKGLKSAETSGAYARILHQIREWLGKEIYEATPNELRDYFLDCIKRGVKTSSLQTYKAGLSSFAKFLISEEESPFHRLDDISRRVKSDIDTVSRDKTIRKALTPEQREIVYQHLKWTEGIHEYQISLSIIFGFHLGFRRFEIAKVQWDEVDLENGTINVIGKGKKKVDGLELSKLLLEKLKDYRMLVDKAKVDSRWVFHKPGMENHHMSKESVYEWYQLVKRRCGFPEDFHFGVHQGRRVFCTLLHEKKIDPLTAIKLSRHEDVKVYQGYVRIDKEKTAKALHDAID